VQKSLIRYSLVIPCYNESDNLSVLIDRCVVLLENREDVEVLLVNNGSTDNTHIELKDLLKSSNKINLRIVHIRKNQGYGFGIVSGLKECNGDIIGWTHADLQTDPVDFISAISIFENSNYSSKILVKGNRVDRPFKDVFFTWSMSLIERIILGVRMRDINAQPTVFSKDFFASLESVPNDFSLDLFVYYKAISSGMSIKRFPVNFGLRLKGKGHNETLLCKLKYSYKTILYSIGLRRRLKRSFK
jgi:glycosyltransferase involved in cell wall biosynthesis